MIIFDLDGTLAYCEHRRHFVDPEKAGCIKWINTDTGKTHWGTGYIDGIFQHWKPDWKSFFEACDKDKPIWPIKSVLIQYCHREIEIWSGRCESVRKKTEKWLSENIFDDDFNKFKKIKLKMRPIGDFTPDDILKEKWLDELLTTGQTVDFVFDDRPKVVRMWRRRGIFVFNCNQTEDEF